MDNIPTKKFIYSVSYLLSLSHYVATLILAQRKGIKQGQKSAVRDCLHQHSCSKKVSRPMHGEANVSTADHCFSIRLGAETMCSEVSTLSPTVSKWVSKEINYSLAFSGEANILI